MPRQSKPYFRAQTQSYYCSINGKQVPLGKSKSEAFAKFHELMADKDCLRSESSTVYELTQTYLDWCQNNRKKVTYVKHLHYLKSFVESVGKKVRVEARRIGYHPAPPPSSRTPAEPPPPFPRPGSGV